MVGAMTTAGALNINATNGVSINGALHAATVNVQTSTTGITLGVASSIAATGSGDAIILNDGSGNFTMGTYATVSDPNGYWLIYATDPTYITSVGLVNNFVQYNTAYGGTILGSGNGFIYSYAPAALSFSLTGSVVRNYNGTTNATLSYSNFASSALSNGDTLTGLTWTGATYSTPNVGSPLLVTASGIGSLVVKNGSANVYGYTLASTTATGNIGTINKANLIVTANNVDKVLGTPDPALTYTVTNLYDPVATVLSGSLTRTPGQNIGLYAINQGSLTQTSFANYNAFVFVPGTFAILAPTVVQEITDLSLKFGVPKTGTATTPGDDDRKRESDEVLASELALLQGNGTGSTLPICK